MNRRLKRSVVYSLYALSICMLIGGIILLEVNSKKLKNDNASTNSDNNYQYVSKTGIDRKDIPVVSTKNTLIRPYNDTDIKVLKSFYDYKSTEDEQQNSIIYYEDTYIQSSGVSYGKEEEFDVIAVFDGKVTSVKEDELLGNVVIIENNNGIKATYESIKDIKVKEGDTVSQGNVIAKSSTSNISKDLNNHLYFELTVKDTSVNPEKYFDKSIETLMPQNSMKFRHFQL